MDFTSAVIGMIATVLGGVLSYAAFHRNLKKDSEETGKASGTMLTEIGYIKANTDEIKNEQREQRKTNVELISRLTAVESSAKQAHKRMDRLEGNEAHER